jgi:type VI secretion system protein ImpC
MTMPLTLTTTVIEAVLGRPAAPLERACLLRGLRAFLAGGSPVENLVDVLLGSLEVDLARQLDGILHHPRFQALEGAWRGLWLLVSRVAFADNARCEVLNCSKEDLLADFEDAPEIPKSALYKHLYSAEYGPFGGRPQTAVLADYAIGPDDLPLLRACAEASIWAFTPFIAGMSPALAGRATAAAVAAEGFALPSPARARWQAFREAEAARNAALVFPRTLARPPHPGETIAGPDDLLWQNGVYALGVCPARSFEICRLPCNITGPVDGRIEDLPAWSDPMGSFAAPSPAEAWLSEARQAELAAHGVIPLGAEPGTGEACFSLAPTCLAEAAPAPEDLSSPDRALHRQLPALLLVARFGQTLKVLHREQIGTWQAPEELLAGLRDALSGWTYQPGDTAEGPAAPLHARTRRPLRSAEVRIETGRWYHHFDLRLEPNWSLDGRFFTVAARGKLDGE